MFQRHDLVYLSAAGWQQIRQQLPSADLEMADQWERADWPAIVRRDESSSAAAAETIEVATLNDQYSGKLLSIGIALPRRLDGSKHRLALRIAASHVSSLQKPVKLVEAAGSALEPWRQGLLALDAQAKKLGISLQVFGSLAMQSLTGLSYLHADSDIDILFSPVSKVQLQAGLGLLANFSHDLPLDGEVQFPDASAVAWKELSAYSANSSMAGMRVLTKSLHRVALLPISALLAGFEQAA